jgi:AAA15 family ATPase/GTPase
MYLELFSVIWSLIMIESFSVKNFRSIKHEQTISFLANNKIQGSSDTYVLNKISDSVSLLKFCILYGYNASGKTNILRALDFLRSLVVDGTTGSDTGTGFEPFTLDETTTQEPGTFALIFYIEQIRYTYRFIVDKKHFISEELTYQPMGRKALLFRRTHDEGTHISTVEFGTKCGLSAKERATLSGNTVDTISTLFAYQKSNIHSVELELVVAYFNHVLKPVVTPNTSVEIWTGRVGQSEMIPLSNILLQRSGLHIEGVRVSEKNPAPVFQHRTSLGFHSLPFDEESQGTLRYLGLGTTMLDGGVIPIDELEASLHPDLVAFLLQMFLLNTTGSQIIATTHNQSLMELDFMRNDMIWLCEKDEDGASEYYSVQEFGLHKRISIGNAYRAGKLGAKPYLGDPTIQL